MSLFHDRMNEHERKILVDALSLMDGNATRTARYLGLNRKSVYNKISKHGIKIEKVAAKVTVL